MSRGDPASRLGGRLGQAEPTISKPGTHDLGAACGHNRRRHGDP